jgi:hypothetical protein
MGLHEARQNGTATGINLDGRTLMNLTDRFDPAIADRISEVRSLAEWVPNPGRPRVPPVPVPA